MKIDEEVINKRLEFLIYVFICLFGIIAIKLFYLQVIKHGFYKRKAQRQHFTTIQKQAARGSIYDLKGNPLAISIKTESICVCPERVRYKHKVARYLSKKLGLTYETVLKKLKSKKEFEYIKRKVDLNIAEEIKKKKFKGIFTQIEEKRFYPLNEIGAHVIGFSGVDNKGLEGLEYQYDKYLRGKNGSVLIRKDAKRRNIEIDTITIRKEKAGANLYLTLDSTLQYYAQKELKKTIERYNAKSGSVIIINPNTGAIYTMAVYPEFNPNNFRKYSPEIWRNRTITDIFEPGSTFKIFTMSAFLKKFKDGMNYKVFCENGKYFFFDRYVHDHEKHGWLSVPEIIKYSSNIGIVKLALKLEPKDLYNEYRLFGFGSKTNIDLPGEVDGILRNYNEWDNTTLTSIPYGQEVAVTAIQLVRAYSVIANGGYLITPYIVEKIKRNNKIIFKRKIKKKKILSDDVRKELVKMLETVVTKEGTGKKARIKGYKIAGKTGTAQKHKKNGKGYLRGKYVASFIGFLPAEKPKILTLVIIDEPKPPFYYGGDVAAPLFAKINNLAISHLKIPSKIKNRNENANEKIFVVELPDFRMKKYKMAKRFLKKNNIKCEKIGYGHFVIKQIPEPKSIIKDNEKVYLFLGDKEKNGKIRIYMPDLQGFSLRKTLKILSVYNLVPVIKGSGIVVSQDPLPGVAVKKGTKCIINFSLKGE